MPQEITVELENRPGTLAEMGETLGKANINIQALGGFAVGNKGIAKVVVDDAKAARKALEGVGIRVTGEKEAFFINLPDRPGTLGEFARKIANAGVNIESGYGTGDRLAITVDDATKAKKLM